MIVYKISGPTNKIYIGSTADLKKRIREHRCVFNAGSKYPLYKDMQAYGFDAFTFEIIAKTKTLKESRATEQAIIKSYQPGKLYNHTVRSDRHRELLSVAGKIKNKKTNHMSKMAMINWDKNREHLVKVAKDISDSSTMSHRSKIGSIKRHIIKVSSKSDGSSIGYFTNYKWVAESLNMSETSVHRYIRGKRRHKKYNFEVTLGSK